METKILLMLALLAPILMLAAGIFARRQTTGAEMEAPESRPTRSTGMSTIR